MVRRRYRPLQLSTGSPTIENGLRPPGRRRFRQLTGATEAEPIPPVLGTIYRTYAPTVIADYLSIATCSWVTGTTGTGSGWPINYNMIYFYFLVTNPRTTTVSNITPPIRWTCDVPTSNGQPWDWWNNGGATPVRYEAAFVASNTGVASRSNNVVGLTKGVLPVSGNSHVQIPAAGVVVGSYLGGNKFFLQYAPVDRPIPSGTGYYQVIPNLDAIDITVNSLPPTDSPNAGFEAKEYTRRYYVNGVLTSLVNGYLPIVAGDQVIVDAWYQVKWTKGPTAAPNQNTRKFAVWFPVSKVSNSSTRVASRIVQFSPVEMGGTLFNPASHTYTVTISGPMSWVLPGGTTGPEKMRTHGLYGLSVTNEYVRWYHITPNVGPQVFTEMRLNYAQEIATFTIVWSASFRAANSVPPTCTYTPASTGDYLTSTVPRDQAATVTHCAQGCFDQAGTTTFNLVDWSKTYDGGGVAGGPVAYHRGKIAGVIPPVVEVPSTITVTRTTR